jgi:probable F420-dependent oxidoreductase
MTRLNFGIRIPAVHPTDLVALRAFVRHVEELGFHSIWVGDHVFYPTDVLEPLELLTWVAALTGRVRLGTAVMLGAYRQPVLLAKAAATLDYLSDGRLSLGLSIGGTAAEYASLGVAMRQRVGRLLEGAALMRELWRDDDVSFAGRYVSVQHASIHPKPAQAHGVPLYFGATGEAMRQRAAQHADGWIGSAGSSIERYLTDVQSTVRMLTDLNREAGGFAFAKLQGVSVHSDPAEARAVAERQWRSYYGPRFDVDTATVYGTPADCAAHLGRLRAADVPELTVIMEPPTLGLVQLDLLWEAVTQLVGAG